MPDTYPAISFYFSVKIGAELYSFKEVSGIGTEMQVQEVSEGGENLFIHRLPKGIKQSNLTLKRCLLSPRSGLYTWCVDTLEQCKIPFITKTIEVQLLSPGTSPLAPTPVRGWSFENAYPLKWEIDKFDAQENKVAIETIVLCYHGMKKITL